MRRVLVVTVALAATGAITGAVCGVLALAPMLAAARPPYHAADGALIGMAVAGTALRRRVARTTQHGDHGAAA